MPNRAAAAGPSRVQPGRGEDELRGSPFPAWFGDNHACMTGGGLLWCAFHDGGGGKYLLARECFVDFDAKAALPAEQRRCRGCGSASQARRTRSADGII